MEAPKVEPAKTEAAAQVEVTEEAARGGATTTQPKVRVRCFLKLHRASYVTLLAPIRAGYH